MSRVFTLYLDLSWNALPSQLACAPPESSKLHLARLPPGRVSEAMSHYFYEKPVIKPFHLNLHKFQSTRL